MESELTIPQEKRHCIELNLAGQPCGNRPVAERARCYIHGIYHALNDGRSTIDIPLLEDPQAILYVYSQVARALAQGTMPAARQAGQNRQRSPVAQVGFSSVPGGPASEFSGLGAYPASCLRGPAVPRSATPE